MLRVGPARSTWTVREEAADTLPAPSYARAVMVAAPLLSGMGTVPPYGAEVSVSRMTPLTWNSTLLMVPELSVAVADTVAIEPSHALCAGAARVTEGGVVSAKTAVTLREAATVRSQLRPAAPSQPLNPTKVNPSRSAAAV